jgi:hypothetical protein
MQAVLNAPAIRAILYRRKTDIKVADPACREAIPSGKTDTPTRRFDGFMVRPKPLLSISIALSGEIESSSTTFILEHQPLVLAANRDGSGSLCYA